MSRRLALPLLAASALLAQSTHEITGVLLDKVTNQGIAGATVFLQSGSLDDTGPPGLYMETDTDGAGKFRFTLDREGRYTLSVPGVKGYQGGSAFATVSATSANPGVRIVLDRTTEVRGQVIDAETREPVAGLGLFMTPLMYRGGLLTVVYSGIRVNTNSEGQFRDSALSGGRYAAHIVPKLWSTSARHMAAFAEEDLQKVDEDFEESYWPGGAGLPATLPQSVAPGAPVDFGTMPVRKTTYYRARLRLAPGSCQGADRFGGTLFRVSGPDLIEDSRVGMICGQDLLLRGLSGGTSYSLSMSGRTFGQLTYATLPFTVTNGNLDLTVAPARGADLEGRVVLAAGARSWPEKMRVGIQPKIVDGRAVAFIAPPQSVPVNADGRFRAVNVPLGENWVTVTELGSAHVIQEVRLAGNRIAVNTPGKFEWQGGGALEIVVDDQPAMITGTVSDGGRNASQPLVLVVPWPLSSSRDLVPGDSEGKFRSPPLRSGDYLVLALPAGARERIEEPGVLDWLLNRAEKVTVMRGTSVSVSLTLLDPGR